MSELKVSLAEIKAGAKEESHLENQDWIDKGKGKAWLCKNKERNQGYAKSYPTIKEIRSGKTGWTEFSVFTFYDLIVSVI